METVKHFHQGQSRPHLDRVLAGLSASGLSRSAMTLWQTSKTSLFALIDVVSKLYPSVPFQ